jgi:hypothetical protein
MFREINGPDDAVWRDRVAQYIDLNQFMTHVAIETFIAENDGILGYAGMNNFYLYRHEGTMRHQLFVWDKDNAFISLDMPVKTTDPNVLFQRAMEHPDLRETYFQTLEECARMAAADDWLALEIDHLVGVVIDAVYADEKKQFSNERFDEAVDFLREFAARRPQDVLREVAQIRKDASLVVAPPCPGCGLTAVSGRRARAVRLQPAPVPTWFAH